MKIIFKSVLVILLLGFWNALSLRLSCASVRECHGKIPRRLKAQSDNNLDNINDMTVAELKDVLRSMNLPVSGLKATLKARIEDAAASKTAFAYGDRPSNGRRNEERNE